VRQRWHATQADFDRQLAKTAEITGRLNAAMQRPQGNPLRSSSTIAELNVHTQSLLTAMTDIRQATEKLQAQIEDDCHRLSSARDADRKVLEIQPEFAGVDDVLLSQALVGQFCRERIAEIFAWTSVLREVGNEPSLSAGTPWSGVDLVLGSRPKPNVMFRSLQFDCVGRFGEQSIPLQGTLRNLGLQPRCGDDPVEIELRSEQGIEANVSARLDRRSKLPVDRLEFSFLHVPTNEESLGDRDWIAIRLSPAQLSAQGEIRVVGDVVEGSLELTVTGATMSVLRNSVVGGQALLADELDRKLSSIQQFKQEISFSGTVDDVQISLMTDLADQLRDAIAEASEAITTEQQTAQQAELEQVFRSAIAEVRERGGQELARRKRALDQRSADVAELESRIPDSGGLRRIR
jgi:uncharacterized protein (TIGR03545 family)